MPLPWLGPLSAFLIENRDGSLTLFDTGLGSRTGVQGLFDAIEHAGRRIEEVTRILVSHAHVDHYGAARPLVERSGARVVMHRFDAPKLLATTDMAERNARYLERYRRCGVPAREAERVVQDFNRMEKAGIRLDPGMIDFVEDGHIFEFARCAVTALQTPGHSRGMLTLHIPEARILLSSDLLLQVTSPNPALDVGQDAEPDPRSLVDYLASLRRIESLGPIDWAFPAHGEPFRDIGETIASLRRGFERRQARIDTALRTGESTAYDLIPAVFARHRDGDTFFTLSEVEGALEVMEAEGRAARREAAGVEVWRRAGV